MEITLSNGQKLKDLTMNGDMYVSQKKVTLEEIRNNLQTVTIMDGENGTVMQNAVCDTVLHWPEGYLFNIREMTPTERLASMMEDIDMALVELASIVGGE